MYILNIFTFIYYKKTPEICVITLLINPKVYSGDKKYALDLNQDRLYGFGRSN